MSGKNPKFVISELNGQELEYEQEYVPESADILVKEGSEERVSEKISFPKNSVLPRVFNEDLIVNNGNVLFLHEPCFEANLILDGDVVII